MPSFNVNKIQKNLLLHGYDFPFYFDLVEGESGILFNENEHIILGLADFLNLQHRLRLEVNLKNCIENINSNRVFAIEEIAVDLKNLYQFPCEKIEALILSDVEGFIDFKYLEDIEFTNLKSLEIVGCCFNINRVKNLKSILNLNAPKLNNLELYINPEHEEDDLLFPILELTFPVKIFVNTLTDYERS